MKKLLLLACLSAILFQSKAQTISVVAGGNGQGSAYNKFYSPDALYVDASGNLYVTDEGNARIMMFPPGSNSTTMGTVVAGGNGVGTQTNQFHNPTGIVVDSVGFLYVSDASNTRILVFPPGSSSASFGSVFESRYAPNALFINPAGYMYVTDASDNKILKYPPYTLTDTNSVIVANGQNFNNANPFNATSIAVDRNGYLYVGDYDSNRILRYPPNSTNATPATVLAGGNGQGSAANQFDNPYSMCVDHSGNIYVADYNNNRIQKFPPNSTSATNGVTIVGNGLGVGAINLNGPKAIFADANDNIYIADSYNNRIFKLVQPSAGVSEISDEETPISLYPNPNNGSFILHSAGNIGKEYAIYDMIGRTVVEQTIVTDKQSVEIKGLTAGTYCLEIKGSTSKTIRFTVNP